MAPPADVVPALVARVAVANRERTAIETRSGSLSYGGLEDRSTTWARTLRARGCGREALVGLCASRTPEMIVALLAILKSGAAYLPLDPTYPPERLAAMVLDSGARVLITERTLAGRVPQRADVTTLYYDDLDAGGGEPLESPAADDLAYVIYTSGSTGRPKGVEITHGSLANFVGSMALEPGIDRADRVLAHTTLSFDIAALELWVTLSVGATLLLVDDERARDGAALVRELSERRATVAQATPTMWSLMLEHQSLSDVRLPSPLKALVGGEPLPRDLAVSLCRHASEAWNMYGPTETTVWSSLWRIQPDAPIRIGHPIDWTTLHVLDEERRPLPAGRVGELYIGGKGVARGYRHRPDLTAERFVPDPFSTEAGARLYRTGDLARRTGDGFECLGRIDQQVKINGYRIELGEIEATLATHPGVAQTAVKDVEVRPGDRRLIAYVVPRASRPAVHDLRERAAATLPDYMVPSAFMFLDALPRLPNGKLNREALLTPDLAARPAGLQYTPPRTHTERVLCEMWSDVLGVIRVGVFDNFFELGGRSRLAARLFARIAADLDRALPLATLFEAPTVAALAAIVDSNKTIAPPGIIALHEGAPAASRPFFCMHPVGGHVMSYRPLARALGGGIPFYGIQAAGLDPTRPPHRTVEAMAAYAIEMMKTVQPQGPYALGGASFGGLVAFDAARLLAARGERVSTVALFDTEFPPAAGHGWIRTLSASDTFRTAIYSRVRRIISSLKPLARRALRLPGRTAPADPVTNTITRVMHTNYRAMAAYLPSWYAGRVVYFRAADAHPVPDTRGEWRLVARELVVIDVPGDHYTMRTEPHVHALAGALRSVLREPPSSVVPVAPSSAA